MAFFFGYDLDTIINGTNVFDIIYGRGGNDTIFGFGGNGIILSGSGHDFFDDELYNNSVFIEDIAIVDKAVTFSSLVESNSSGSIDGTTGNDNLTGTSGDDVINGLAGNDILNGLAGDDVINGGDGADTLIGGEGADALNGGAGFDSADYRGATSGVRFNVDTGGTFGEANGDSFSGIERYFLSDFNDIVTGSDANEFFFGGAGNDTINGGDGIDRIDGGDGNDIQRGQAGNDTLFGSAGADQLNGGTGVDVASYDLATSAVAVNLATGGTLGDAAGDTYFGIEIVVGSDFDDVLTGNNSVNDLRGGDGDDILNGGGGNDRLFGGEGADAFDGGAGFDIVNYTLATSGVGVLLAGEGFAGEALGDTFTSIEWVIGSDFDDDITGDAATNRLEGRGGNDTLNGEGGNDRLLGGDGNDTINGGDGIDTIFGQDGNDRLFGDAGNDFFFGSAGGDSIDGGDDFDTVSYLASTSGVIVNLADGGTGGDADGDTYVNIERVFGTSFDDSITGSDENDVLLGNGGSDFLNGGQGNDSLNGGAGIDSFGYDTSNGGADVINDFFGGETIFILGGNPAFANFAALQAIASDAGNNVIFNFGGGNTLTVVGRNLADLSAEDFDFGDTPSDGEPPMIDVTFAVDTGQSDTDTITNDVLFTGTVTDDVAVTELTFSTLFNSEFVTIDATGFLQADGSFSLSLTDIESLLGEALPDGFNSIAFNASDAAGNIGFSESFTFALDRAGPSIVTAPTGILGEAPDTLVVNFSDNVDFDALSVEDFSLINQAGETLEIVSLNQTLNGGVELNLARALDNDDYTLNVDFEFDDAAGNTSTAQSFDFSVAAPTRVTNIAPSDSLELVNIDRQIIVEFDREIDASTLTTDTFQVLVNGEALEGFVRVSANDLMATFFLADGAFLPASSTVQIVLDGENILDANGESVDVNGDGIAGGTSITDFSTVSLTSVAGTNFTAQIFNSNQVDENGDDIPLEGVIVSVVGRPDIFAVTDENGEFTLTDLPVGQIFVEFDATNVDAADGFQFGAVVEPVTTIAGQTVGATTANGDPFVIYFASIAEGDAVDIVAGEETQVGVGEAGLANLAELFPDIDPAQWELLQLTIPADSLFDDDQNLAESVSLAVFEPSRIPAPLPQGFDPTVVFTVVAEGAENVDSNAQLTFPNIDDLPPGARRPIYSFDHAEGQWVQTGTAVVSADGTVLVSEGDGGINTLGWKFVGSNPVSTHTQEVDVAVPGRFTFEDPTVIIDGQIQDATEAASGNISASIIQATGLAVSVADALEPADELVPGLGPAIETLSLGLGGLADQVADGMIDPEGQSFSLSASLVGALPGASTLGDFAGVGADAFSLLDFVEDGAEATITALALSTVSTTGNENIGIRSQQILDAQAAGMPVIPLGQQNNNTSVESSPTELLILSINNAGTSSFVDTSDPVVNAAQGIIDEIDSVLLNATSLQITQLTNNLSASITNDGRLPDTAFLEISGGGTSAFAGFLDQSGALPTEFGALISEAQSNFLIRAQEISDAGGSSEEMSAALGIARDEFFSDIMAAIDDFNNSYDQLVENVNDELVSLSNNISDIATLFADRLETTSELGIEFIELGIEAEELIETINLAIENGEDIEQFESPLRSLSERYATLQDDIEAFGFSTIHEVAQDYIDNIFLFSELAQDSLITALGDLNEVFVQVIFEDGTILRSTVSSGEEFSVNGEAGTSAVLRFFDPVTNLFTESTITFGENNTNGSSVLSEILTLDSDGDGIADLGEEVIGTDPFSADSDGDGRTDGAEIISGTSPTGTDTSFFGVIGGVLLAGDVLDVEVVANPTNPDGRTAFALTEAGLSIVDVSTIANPVINSQITIEGVITDFAVDSSNNLAYIATNAGITVVDISNPVSPFIVDGDFFSSQVTQVEIFEGLLLVGDSDGLILVDPFTGESLASILLGGNVDDIFVTGNTIFVVESNQSASSSNFANLNIFDFNGFELTLTGQTQIPVQSNPLQQPDPLQIFVDNGIAYVSTGFEVTNVAPSRPLERGGFQTFDVSDTSNPTLISSIDTGNNQAANFQTISNGSGLGVVAAGSFGVQFFNIEDPNNTFDLEFAIDTLGNANRVTVVDGFAFVADGSGGLQILSYASEGLGGAAPQISISISDEEDADSGSQGLQLRQGQEVTLQLDVTDDVQVTRVQLRLNGEIVETDISVPFDLSFIAQLLEGGGQNTVEVIATDVAGNETVSNTLTFDVLPDSAGPAALGFSLDDGDVLLSNNFSVSVVFDQLIDPDSLSNTTVQFIDNNDPSIMFEADGFVLSSFGETQLVRFFFSDLPEGDFNAVFSGSGIQDLAGNAFTGSDLTSQITLLESLFSPNADNVALDNFLANNPDDGVGGLTFLDALGGDDVVVLASDVGTNGLDLGGETFLGGAGDDTILPLNDFMNADGGAGSDTIDFSQLLDQSTGVMVDLTAQTVSGASSIALSSFENVVGTAGDDILTGSTVANFLQAGAGDDTVIVAVNTDGSLDQFEGGAGTDTLDNNGNANLILGSFTGFETVNLGGSAAGGSLIGTNNSEVVDLSAIAFREANSNLLVDVGAGDDQIIGISIGATSSTGFSVTRETYDLGGGNDSFTGSTVSISESILGGQGDDVINGGGGSDFITGGAGADTLIGGLGNDDFFVDSSTDDTETDSYLGGLGTDRLVNTGEANIRLDNWDSSDPDGTASGSGIEDIRLNGFAVEGSLGDDSYNFVATRFEQLDNDTRLALDTGAGNDTVIGSSVTSISVASFGGFTRYNLGAGDDSFTGQGNIIDHIYGEAGDDVIDGGAGSDDLFGGAGADTLIGGLGNDDFFVDSSTDDTETDSYLGGAGTDRLVNTGEANIRLDNWDSSDPDGTASGSGIEDIRLNGFAVEGSSGNDSYNFVATQFEQLDNDTRLALDAGAGNDTVIGSSVTSISVAGFGGFTRYNLAAGDDSFTGAGNIADHVDNGAGDDIVSTGGGSDTLFAGVGDDQLFGGAGSDDFIIRADDDYLNDLFIGGTGTDDIINETGGNLVFTSYTGGAHVEGSVVNGNGIENIILEGQGISGTTSADNLDFSFVSIRGADIARTDAETNALFNLGAGDDTVVGAESTIIGSNAFGFNGTYNLGAGNDSFISNSSLSDIIFDGAGNDTVSTGAGNDTYVGGSGSDVVDLGAGNDVVDVRHQTEFGFDELTGGTGSDRINNTSGGDFAIGGLTTGSGFEQIFTDGFTMNGTSGDDVFDLTGISLRELSNGQTVLSTGGGNDTVIASNLGGILASGFGVAEVAYDLGAGDDIYIDAGAADAQIIIGGSGNDTFIFSNGWGDDVITDFDALSDFETIDLSAVTEIFNFSDLLANHAAQIGADVVITDGSNSLTLNDVNLADLDENDFVFGTMTGIFEGMDTLIQDTPSDDFIEDIAAFEIDAWVL